MSFVKSLLFPLNQDNVFKGLTYAMLLCATMHLAACLYHSLVTGNPDYINMFNILGLSIFFPSLGTGAFNCLLGILLVIAIGIWFYVMQQLHDRHPNSRKKTRA